MFQKPLNFAGYDPSLESDDFRHHPAVSAWMIFGRHPVTGHVDVTDSEGSDVFVGLPSDVAEEMLSLRSEFVEGLLMILNRHLAKQAT